MSQTQFKPGDRVIHKVQSAQPRLGTVLAEDDPRVWAGSLRFPGVDPDPEAVKEHLQNCKTQGLLSDGKIPVRWDSGTVYWHLPALLKPASLKVPLTPKAKKRFARHRAKGGKIMPLQGG